MEMIFYSHANKLTHFHKKGFALSLTVKLRVFGTRKRPNKNLCTTVLSYDTFCCQYFKDKNFAFSQIVWYIFHDMCYMLSY